MTGALRKRTNLDTETGTETTPCEDEGRDQDDASTGQGLLKRDRNHQTLEQKRGKGPSLTILRRNQPR